MKLAQFVVLGLLTAGCNSGGLTYNFAASEGVTPVAKDANCEFKIGKGPDDTGKYDKLGTLTAKDFAAQTQEDLHAAIATQVCQLGGDYVIATQDTTGQYKSAIVLRKHLDQQPDAAVPVPNAPPAGPAPAPAPAPAAPGM